MQPRGTDVSSSLPSSLTPPDPNKCYESGLFPTLMKPDTVSPVAQREDTDIEGRLG